ncbi:hypothetical protein [Comamonas sp. HJ-2]|jgi:hypothetical protein
MTKRKDNISLTHTVSEDKWTVKQMKERITASESAEQERFTYAHARGNYSGAELNHRSRPAR